MFTECSNNSIRQSVLAEHRLHCPLTEKVNLLLDIICIYMSLQSYQKSYKNYKKNLKQFSSLLSFLSSPDIQKIQTRSKLHNLNSLLVDRGLLWFCDALCICQLAGTGIHTLVTGILLCIYTASLCQMINSVYNSRIHISQIIIPLEEAC